MSDLRCNLYRDPDQVEPRRALRPGETEKWAVEYDGSVIVERSRDPEHDACRALLARGVTGMVTFVHRFTGTAGLTMDIEKGARRSVDEATRDGKPRVRKYRPYPATGSSPASVSASDGPELPEAAE